MLLTFDNTKYKNYETFRTGNSTSIPPTSIVVWLYPTNIIKALLFIQSGLLAAHLRPRLQPFCMLSRTVTTFAYSIMYFKLLYRVIFSFLEKETFLQVCNGTKNK